MEIYRTAAIWSRRSIRCGCSSARVRGCSTSSTSASSDRTWIRSSIPRAATAGFRREAACERSSRDSADLLRSTSVPSSATYPTATSACGCRRVPARPHAVPLQPEERRNLLCAADRRRGSGALPAHALRRPEALLARGRRCSDRSARRSDPAGRRARRRGVRARHGAPRPPQRAGQRARQGRRRICSREFEGKYDREPHGLGRRQVPQGLLGRRAHARRQRARRRSRSIPRTWRSSIRSSRDRCARARSAAATRSATGGAGADAR